MPEYIEIAGSSWPGTTPSSGDEWPCNISSISYEYYKRLRVERTFVQPENTPCEGQSVVEYYTETYTESGTCSKSHATEAKRLKTYLYPRFLYGLSEFPQPLATHVPEGDPEEGHQGIAQYPPISGWLLGAVYSTLSSATHVASGQAQCVFYPGDQQAVPPTEGRYVLELFEDSSDTTDTGETDNSHISLLGFSGIYRRWLHQEWGWLFKHSRMQSDDKNYGDYWRGTSSSKKFVLTIEPLSAQQIAAGWVIVDQEEYITITLNTA